VLYRMAPFAIDDYQIKPLSAKRLTQQIRSLLDRNRNARAVAHAGAQQIGTV
jgi:DNA-binding response OmpR family regulator